MVAAAEGESILEKIQRESGIPLPPWTLGVLSLLILLALLVTALKPLWPGIKAVGSSVKGWVTRRKQDQRRAERRSKFADYIEGQMRRLGEKEEWRDNRYAELEAEVELLEDRSRRFFRRVKPETRRMPSLSKALEHVRSRLVLLEGDPGSGKSVALRHLTQLMCLRLIRRPSERDPIPLYINLKEFRPAGPTVTASDVRSFVISSVNRGRNRDIDQYMANEFDKGVEEGTWLFLFDSFDEIPAILSATEANEIIEQYSDALYDFLHGMGACRGIVASREFRGPPRRNNWPKFTIVPLSWNRKIELIRKADLGAAQEQALIDDLRDAPSELRSISDNPMFLGLLCEHSRDGNTGPASAHVVTESYISERFSRDADRIRDICAVEPELVREVAEELAIRIASEQALGLSVERRAVVTLLAGHLGHSEDEVQAALDALEYTKLARDSDNLASAAEGTSITFSHRRIQEYFVTCMVLRDASRVDPRSLVLDGRWREAAVTVLQVQDAAQVRGVLEVITESLVAPDSDEQFTWQANQFHLLEILADGGGYAKYRDGPPRLTEKVDAILTAAWQSGSRRNRKWALEVCSAATPELALRFIREAFEGDSEWLRGEAYNQARRVRQVTTEIEAEIRQTLLDFSISGDLRRSYRSVRAQVSRIANPTDLLHAVSLLRAAPVVDYTVFVILVLWLMSGGDALSTVVMVCVGPLLWLYPRAVFARIGGNKSRWRRALRRLAVSLGKLNTTHGAPRVVYRPRVLLNAVGLVFARSVFVMILFSREEFAWVALLPALLSLLSGTWLVGALYAVQSGQWLSPHRWPMLFVLSWSRVARDVSAVVPPLDRKTAWNIVSELMGVLATSAAGGAVIFVGSLIPWEKIPDIVIQIAVFAIAIVIATVAVFAFVEKIRSFRRDRSQSKITDELFEVDATWLVGRFTILRGPDAILLLLRNLRAVTPAPVWHQDAIELLSTIGRLAEAWRIGDSVTRSRARADFLALSASHGADLYSHLYSFSRTDVLDEIGRIEDEVSANREVAAR